MRYLEHYEFRLVRESLREAHDRFGMFNIDLHRTMDYDLILRLGLNEGPRRFVRVEAPFACFRRHPEQKTTGAGRENVLREHVSIAAEHGLMKKYTAWGKALRMAYRVRRAWWYFKRGGLSFAIQKLVGSLNQSGRNRGFSL